MLVNPWTSRNHYTSYSNSPAFRYATRLDIAKQASMVGVSGLPFFCFSRDPGSGGCRRGCCLSESKLRSFGAGQEEHYGSRIRGPPHSSSILLVSCENGARSTRALRRDIGSWPAAVRPAWRDVYAQFADVSNDRRPSFKGPAARFRAGGLRRSRNSHPVRTTYSRLRCCAGTHR